MSINPSTPAPLWDVLELRGGSCEALAQRVDAAVHRVGGRALWGSLLLGVARGWGSNCGHMPPYGHMHISLTCVQLGGSVPFLEGWTAEQSRRQGDSWLWGRKDGRPLAWPASGGRPPALPLAAV